MWNPSRSVKCNLLSSSCVIKIRISRNVFVLWISWLYISSQKKKKIRHKVKKVTYTYRFVLLMSAGIYDDLCYRTLRKYWHVFRFKGFYSFSYVTFLHIKTRIKISLVIKSSKERKFIYSRVKTNILIFLFFSWN